jgi:hypothetical protein
MGFSLPISSQEQASCKNYQPQVEMEHDADQKGNEVGPWQADVKQSTAKCGGSESVFLLATVTGKALFCFGFEAFTANKYANNLSILRS